MNREQRRKNKDFLFGFLGLIMFQPYISHFTASSSLDRVLSVVTGTIPSLCNPLATTALETELVVVGGG